eukprot:TRINITY_DN9491_c0_g1_i1.p2 TRINITY_DN9491_c0_g1~~TRINITY_DN9491_c0_g1_i1.p2  ORF type:complete len:116 (-),score=22.83 TRINITY_DN9491_c0_g1_i1:255-602(-)
MELHRVQLELFVGQTSNDVTGSSNDFEAICGLIDGVPMCEQDLFPRFKAGEQAARAVNFDLLLAILTMLFGMHSAAKRLVDELQRVLSVVKHHLVSRHDDRPEIHNKCQKQGLQA